MFVDDPHEPHLLPPIAVSMGLTQPGSFLACGAGLVRLLSLAIGDFLDSSVITPPDAVILIMSASVQLAVRANAGAAANIAAPRPASAIDLKVTVNPRLEMPVIRRPFDGRSVWHAVIAG